MQYILTNVKSGEQVTTGVASTRRICIESMCLFLMQVLPPRPGFFIARSDTGFDVYQRFYKDRRKTKVKVTLFYTACITERDEHAVSTNATYE